MVAHRLAVVTAIATGVLIVFGGLVTNTGAGLAVPDWPTTFGHNMFLYPWSQMIGGVFYEHSHRLLGALVGLLTLALAASLWRAGGRLRWLGAVAVVAVITQGVLGGLRVVLLREQLAVVHGCVAQAFFGLLAALVLVTAPNLLPAVGVEPATRRLTLLAAALVYAQIVFGALLTHAGRTDLHLVGALAVFALVPVITARVRRGGDPVAARVARVLLVVLGLQLALGIGSFLSRFSAVWIPGGQVTMLALPVAHRVAASVIFGAVVMLAVRMFQAPAMRLDGVIERRGSLAGPVPSVQRGAP
jgi:cytochrome c oxidase assembly protein subunit 15